MKRIRVRPTKPGAIFSGIVGIIFIVIGVTVAIPTFGLFGVFWTLMAIGITAMNLYSAFGKKGGLYELEMESEDVEGFEVKLRKLKSLYDDGIITRQEYERKKDEILKSDIK